MRNSLVWLVLGAVVPLLIFGAITASTIFSQKRKSLGNDLASTAAALSVAVDRELLSQFRTMDVLAAASLADSDGLRRFDDLAKRAVKANPEWINIGLIDPATARIIAGAPHVPAAPTYSLSPAHVAEVNVTKKPVVAGTFVRGQLTPVPVVILMTPIIRNDRVRYVLGVAMKPTALSDIFRAQGMSSTWTGAVLDDRKVISGRSRDAQLYVGTPATASLQEQMGDSKAGLFTAANKEGASVYTVFRTSDQTGWSVVIGVPTQELDAPLHLMLLELVGAAAVLLILASVVSIVVGIRSPPQAVPSRQSCSTAPTLR